MKISRALPVLGLAAAYSYLFAVAAVADTTLLNASYDVSRELYKDINPAFTAHWQKAHSTAVEVKQAHGGSTKQAQAVAQGLEADVVTLNQPTDLDFLVSSGVATVVEKRKTGELAKGYLDFLYSDDAQRIIAKHNFRPRSATVLKETASQFPAIKTFTVEDKVGAWADVQKLHFADGGIYDQVTTRNQ